MHRGWAPCCLLCVVLSILAGCKQKPSNAPQSTSPAVSAKQSGAEVPIPAVNLSESPVRPSAPIEFTDVTAQAGIHFKHNSGAFGKKYLPETMGSGVCFLDYDNDGWQDILLVNSMDWPEHRSGKSFPALYHNNQRWHIHGCDPGSWPRSRNVWPWLHHR